MECRILRTSHRPVLQEWGAHGERSAKSAAFGLEAVAADHREPTAEGTTDRFCHQRRSASTSRRSSRKERGTRLIRRCSTTLGDRARRSAGPAARYSLWSLTLGPRVTPYRVGDVVIQIGSGSDGREVWAPGVVMTEPLKVGRRRYVMQLLRYDDELTGTQCGRSRSSMAAGMATGSTR